MKKLTAILFTLLLLFNVVGYYALFFGVQYNHKREMTRKLDADEYSNLESVIIKIPLAIPYASDSEEFERVDGEFEYQGEFYRLVKQRLSQDTLFIVCIKDYKKKRIRETEVSLAKSLSERPSEDRSSQRPIPTFIKDYLIQNFSIGRDSFGWECDLLNCPTVHDFRSSFYPSVFLPPDLI